VVASAAVRRRRIGGVAVSIPFIAGQWSLRGGASGGGGAAQRFNPLHCGAVVASEEWGFIRLSVCISFNPLHCGAVVASKRLCVPTTSYRPCFNPLHCGAVVASRNVDEKTLVGAMFQSPSLRGSGRFGAGARCEGSSRAGFNPLHCGAVVASR